MQTFYVCLAVVIHNVMMLDRTFFVVVVECLKTAITTNIVAVKMTFRLINSWGNSENSHSDWLEFIPSASMKQVKDASFYDILKIIVFWSNVAGIAPSICVGRRKKMWKLQEKMGNEERSGQLLWERSHTGDEEQILFSLMFFFSWEVGIVKMNEYEAICRVQYPMLSVVFQFEQ